MRVPRIDEVIRPVANPASRPDRKQYGSPWKLCKISGQISARLNPLLLLSGIDQSCRSGQFLFTDRQSTFNPTTRRARSIQLRPSRSGAMGRTVNWTSISSSRDYMAIGLALIARMNGFELWKCGLRDCCLVDNEIERYIFRCICG